MNDQADSPARFSPLSRRQAVAALASLAGSLAICASAQAGPGGGGMGGMGGGGMGGGGMGGTSRGDSSSSSRRRTFLHYAADFNAPPERVYTSLLDSNQFAAFTGQPAEINPIPGGQFTLFGGLIVGRIVELVPDERIVQAWRPTQWDPGVYSLVKFDLRPMGSRTHLLLDHTGFPTDEANHLDDGWKSRYLKPLAKYFA